MDDEHSDYKVVDEADIAEEDRTSPIQIQTGGYDRYLFVLLFILCFFSNGFMPSIATFVSMPYGIQGIYHHRTFIVYFNSHISFPCIDNNVDNDESCCMHYRYI